MIISLFSSLWRSSLPLLILAATLAISGCNNMPSNNVLSQNPSDHLFTQCPSYNPEKNICTAQYDPVCVTIKNGSMTNKRTAGNACSACGSALAIGYVKGECS